MITTAIVSWVLLLTSPFNGWAEDAQMPLPTGPVHVIDKPCPFGVFEGCSRGSTIWSDHELGRGVFFHQLGRVFARNELDPTERRAFTAAIGWTARWNDRSRPTWARPSGVFAYMWQRCAANNHRPIRFGSFLVPLRCALITTFGGREK